MNKIAILAAAAAAAFPAAAMAQDSGTWTGAHIDVIGGWDQNKSTDVTTLGSTYSKDGIVYGGGIGYDYDTGSMVLGLDAELTDSTVKECAGTASTGITCLHAGRDIYAGARVGVAVGDARDTLLYFKGGYTNGGYKVKSTLAGTTASQSYDDDGYRVGAGVEHKFSENMSAKVEYRHSDYGDGFTRNQVVAGIGFRF